MKEADPRRRARIDAWLWLVGKIGKRTPGHRFLARIVALRRRFPWLDPWGRTPKQPSRLVRRLMAANQLPDDEYLAELQAIIREHPRHRCQGEWHVQLGRVLMRIGDHDAAVKAIRTSFPLGQDSGGNRYLLGCALWFGGKTEEAEAEWTTALTFRSDWEREHWNDEDEAVFTTADQEVLSGVWRPSLGRPSAPTSRGDKPTPAGEG